MAPLTVSISNKSGVKQSYAIFAELPQITYSGRSDIPVTRRIITSVHYVANDEGQAIFTLSKNWYATCGIYDVVAQDDEDGSGKKIGSGTEVVDMRRVYLSRTDVSSGGVKVQGTSLEIECANGTPSFATSSAPSSQKIEADVGCFVIRTKNDFSSQEAKSNKFVVGFTSARRQHIGAYATFVPDPELTYQIKPKSALYVAVGDFNVGDLVQPNLSTQTSTCCVDFANLGTDTVNIVHDDRGVLNVMTAQLTDGRNAAPTIVTKVASNRQPGLSLHL